MHHLLFRCECISIIVLSITKILGPSLVKRFLMILSYWLYVSPYLWQYIRLIKLLLPTRACLNLSNMMPKRTLIAYTIYISYSDIIIGIRPCFIEKCNTPCGVSSEYIKISRYSNLSWSIIGKPRWPGRVQRFLLLETSLPGFLITSSTIYKFTRKLVFT